MNPSSSGQSKTQAIAKFAQLRGAITHEWRVKNEDHSSDRRWVLGKKSGPELF